MPWVIYLVLSVPFPIVPEGIRPIVFVRRGLADISCNLPFLILGLVRLRGPMPFSAVVDRRYSFRKLPCTRDSVLVLFLSMFFRFGSLLLYLLRSSTWLDISSSGVLRVERVPVDQFLSPVICLCLVHTFLSRLPVR